VELLIRTRKANPATDVSTAHSIAVPSRRVEALPAGGCELHDLASVSGDGSPDGVARVPAVLLHVRVGVVGPAGPSVHRFSRWPGGLLDLLEQPIETRSEEGSEVVAPQLGATSTPVGCHRTG